VFERTTNNRRDATDNGGQYGNGESACVAPVGSGVRAVFKIIEIIV